MQLTLLGINLESVKNPSVADLNEIETIILNHDRPELFSAYFSENPEYLNLSADDIYGTLSDTQEERLKEKYLNNAEMIDHASYLMGADPTEVFHKLNEFVNTTKKDCHPIHRVIEAVSDSSYEQNEFNQKDFFRNLVEQFGGLSEVLKHFSDEEIENATDTSTEKTRAIAWDGTPKEKHYRVIKTPNGYMTECIYVEDQEVVNFQYFEKDLDAHNWGQSWVDGKPKEIPGKLIEDVDNTKTKMNPTIKYTRGEKGSGITYASIDGKIDQGNLIEIRRNPSSSNGYWDAYKLQYEGRMIYASSMKEIKRKLEKTVNS